MKKIYLTVLIVFITIITLPGLYAQKIESKNYIVLLDLSDRLLLPHQKDYDLKVIATVFDKFEETVQSKLFVTSGDSFSIRIVPQNGSPVDPYEYGNLLSIDLSGIRPQNRVREFKKFKETFFTNVSRLYDKARFSDKGSDYKGVDIWQYFNQSIEYDLSDSKENILIVLSDGYFDFESYPQGFKNKNKFTSTAFIRNLRVKDWKQIDEKNDFGIIPVNTVSEFNIKVIVAGIRAKTYISFLDENNLLKYYWSKWLNEMNISVHHQISYANSPSVHHLIKTIL